jgi:hypothetical protein
MRNCGDVKGPQSQTCADGTSDRETEWGLECLSEVSESLIEIQSWEGG